MRRVVVAAAVAGLLVAGCGGGGSEEAGPAGAAADPAVYDGVVTALARAHVSVTTCPVTGGDPYEVIRPAARNLAVGASHLQYSDGRLYELGPCETPPERRTLLRIYHFPDQAIRDAAVEASGRRGIRPTSSWTYQSNFTVELWQSDPTDAGPVGAMASAAHLAIGGMPGMRHTMVPTGP
jgi:hypothetical protein